MSGRRFRQGVRLERGFSLVELLIVVVILGIMGGIVAIAVTSSTGNANKNACVGEAKSFQAAVSAAPANNPPVVLSGNHAESDAGLLQTAGLLSSSTFKYLDDSQPAPDHGTYANGWTYNGRSVDDSACA